MIKKCVGCGIPLQSDDINKPGYVPVNDNKRYCMRCFKIMHYNAHIKEDISYNEEELLKIVNKKAQYVYFLIDYLNLNFDTIKVFKKIDVPKILLISKSDIIPSSFKEDKIKKWLQETYNFNNDIEFISASHKQNINKILKNILDLNIKEVYILGFTNAGKSTLINSIAFKYGVEDHVITTSINPNTTLDFIKFKINSNLTLIDTPGFKNEYSFMNNDFNLLKKINPKKEVRPITYQCKKDISFIIEDQIIIYFITANNSITFYISNDLKIDKKYILQTSEKEEYKYDILDNEEIVIKGVGFINIKKPCQVIIYTNEKNLIEKRKSFF